MTPINRPDVEEIQRPKRVSFLQSFRRDVHFKCLLLTLLIICCAAAVIWCRIAEVTRLVVNFHRFPISSRRRTSPCEEGYLYIPVAFMVMLYLVYLVECWHCTTRLELTYKVNATDVYHYIEHMRTSQPLIWWKAICYRYVRRTRQVTRYRNGDAYTAAQIYYERINSHAAASCFVYSHSGAKDVSKRLVDLEKHPATKIRFSKGFAFASTEAANDFEEQRMSFFRDNERIDDYMEMREGLDFIGVDFQEYMVAFADKDQLPWYVSHAMFWIFSFLLLSWPLRVLIAFKTAYVHYQITKLFGADPATPTGEAGPFSRVSTANSSELERHIADSFTLAPSYSEAILFDNNGNLPTDLTYFRDSGLQMDVCSPIQNSNSASSRWMFGSQNAEDRPLGGRRSLPLTMTTYPTSEMRRTSTSPRCSCSNARSDIPPSYEDALLVSRPLRFVNTLRRSITDRDLSSFRQLPRFSLRRSYSRLYGWRKNSIEAAL